MILINHGTVRFDVQPGMKIAQLVVANVLDDPIYQTPSGPITPLDMIFGHSASIGEGSRYMAHKSGFTATTLGVLLREAGFVEVGVARVDYDLRARAHKAED